MVTMSKREKADVEKINALEKRLMADPELAALITDLGTSAVDMNDLARTLLQSGINAALQAEMDAHLGYKSNDRAGKAAAEQGEGAGAATGNCRNGSYRKTVQSQYGPVDVVVPRDRQGTFTPMMVPKGQRRITDVDELIISLYAGGMSVRDIEHHLAQSFGVDVSRETISMITDQVLDDVMIWQHRQLDEFYPVLYLDALRVKVRDGAKVITKACYMAIGIDMDGFKHILGLWMANNEGAAFWAHVCAQLANRGVKDVLIVCCDGLKGLPEAIEATWSNAIVQTCVVHLIRAATRWVNYKDRKAVTAALRNIYTAADEQEAAKYLDEFAASELGKNYQHAVQVWRDAWDRFIPFLQLPPEARKVIYTTNQIESMNSQLRRATRNRGHFPNDEAATKALWLMICHIEDKKASKAAKTQKRANAGSNRYVEGARTAGWKQAINQLAVHYPERFENYL